MQVACFDTWGNATCPSSDLHWALHVGCSSFTPATLRVTFNDFGVASIEGNICMGCHLQITALDCECLVANVCNACTTGLTASKASSSDILQLKLDSAATDGAVDTAAKADRFAGILRWMPTGFLVPTIAFFTSDTR